MTQDVSLVLVFELALVISKENDIKRNKFTVGANNVRCVIYAHFHVAGHFFIDISYKT